FGEPLAETNWHGRAGGDPLLRKPTTGIVGCCARAASGQATAPLSKMMNSRLFTRSPRRRGRAVSVPVPHVVALRIGGHWRRCLDSRERLHASSKYATLGALPRVMSTADFHPFVETR